MDRLAAMTVFRRVVELNGFAAAARDLRLSNAAVSKHVQKLEQSLNARLLDRTTRRVAPTEAGRAYYERCVRILDEIEEAEAAISRHAASPRGTLRVNAPMSFGIRHLSPVLPAFLARFPDIRIDLSLNDRFVDLVEEGFDVAVRIGVLADSSLIARRIASGRTMLVASPDYLARRGRPRMPADLVGHDCLVYTYRSRERDWDFEGPGGPVSVRIDGSLRANNGDMLAQAAAAGIGIAAVPNFIVDDLLRGGRVVPLLREWRPPGFEINAVYPHSRLLSAKVRAFVDFLVERFGTEPPWESGLPPEPNP